MNFEVPPKFLHPEDVEQIPTVRFRLSQSFCSGTNFVKKLPNRN